MHDDEHDQTGAPPLAGAVVDLGCRGVAVGSRRAVGLVTNHDGSGAAGIAILILNNAGFGTAMDFVFCLFWGFGLPVTMDKLVQLTPAGVATPLGISLPKV